MLHVQRARQSFAGKLLMRTASSQTERETAAPYQLNQPRITAHDYFDDVSLRGSVPTLL